MQCRVCHNGSSIEVMDIDRVDDYIKSKLREDLNPTKILDYQRGRVWVEVYEYFTLYQEVFVVTILK